MTSMPKFNIIDVSFGESGQPNIKVVFIDDERFLGHILSFKDIDFGIESDGIGVSYSLDVDIHKNYLPTTITEEHIHLIKEVAHATLNKIIPDFVDTHNRGELDNPVEIM